jgi:hypothetical protein
MTATETCRAAAWLQVPEFLPSRFIRLAKCGSAVGDRRLQFRVHSYQFVVKVR